MADVCAFLSHVKLFDSIMRSVRALCERIFSSVSGVGEKKMTKFFQNTPSPGGGGGVGVAANVMKFEILNKIEIAEFQVEKIVMGVSKLQFSVKNHCIFIIDVV